MPLHKAGLLTFNINYETMLAPNLLSGPLHWFNLQRLQVDLDPVMGHPINVRHAETRFLVEHGIVSGAVGIRAASFHPKLDDQMGGVVGKACRVIPSPTVQSIGILLHLRECTVIIHHPHVLEVWMSKR